MTQRVNALSRVCKCGCGKPFVLKRKDMLFYPGHKELYNTLIYEAGKIAVKNAVQVGNGNEMPTIQSIEEWAKNNRIKPTDKTVKEKNKFNARNIEGSKPLRKMLNLFKRGGSHSTMALNNRLIVTCAPTMASELNWNFNKRPDLPVEYHKYKGWKVISSTRRINKKTVWFYKLMSPFEAFENDIIKGASKKLGIPVKQLIKPIPKRR